ncbi:aminoglycoside phosphotransferase family protein [Arthrobacter sp. CJ23]|uniref:aminoglycoside phosphotransferase family protein n=1 Tax=Arthrobacter sp. CJ23 TaxID=2972479 RepID=UPI00215CE5EB|nr:aminoglycoside phosphotransferase family protein [Arthrobacter sp. CJ23]UVJ39571.1 aminoglycoside phosphotransferase family protein [Arthrobacter sp. CJ23]
MNFFDRFLEEHYQEFGLEKYMGRRWESVLLTPRFVTSRHVVALIFATGSQEPGLVVKVPRQPGENDSLRHEAEVLRALKIAGVGPSMGVPEVVSVCEVAAHTVLVETAVTGTPLDPRLVAADLPGAVSAGADFVDALPCLRSARQNQGWYERTITRPLEALSVMVSPEPEVDALVEHTHELLAPLRSAELPAVVEHGDLSHPNLFLQADGKLQAVDWERSSTDGLPGHDLVFYLQYLSESNERAFSREDQLGAYDAAFGARGWALGHLARHLALRGVDVGLLPQLVIASWARSAATLAYRLEGQSDPGHGTDQVRSAVMSDRDFWLWRHAVTGSSPKHPGTRAAVLP